MIENTNASGYGTGGIVGWIRYNTNSSYANIPADRCQIIDCVNRGEMISTGGKIGGVAGTVYDAVVMNPPFSEECEHIKRAFDFLRPGGSLVAVCSSSIQWKSTRKYEQFRDWLSEHTHSIDECGAKFEMTGVHTVVLVVDKAA